MKSGSVKGFPVASYKKGTGTFLEGLAVVLASKNTVNLSANATTRVVGLVYGKVDTVGGGSANIAVVVDGFARARLGGTVVAGDPLVPNSAGELIKTTTATHLVCAYAEEPGADGEMIEVRIIPSRFLGQDSA